MHIGTLGEGRECLLYSICSECLENIARFEGEENFLKSECESYYHGKRTTAWLLCMY